MRQGLQVLILYLFHFLNNVEEWLLCGVNIDVGKCFNSKWYNI